MSQKLSPGTMLLLATAPLMWAGNAVTGKLVHGLIPPITLNFIRWALAFLILLPFAWKTLRPGSPLWPHWKRYSLLGLLGVGSYNALQYMALQTSSPLNVTLVGGGTPVCMLIIGALFFGVPARRQQIIGATLSVCGVLLVLSHGSIEQLLSLRLVIGDVYMVLAVISWSLYSWFLVRTSEPAAIRGDWAAFLIAQMLFGLGWSGAFAGVEWGLGQHEIVWGWPLAAALVFIVIGPAILAYRCWGLGVQRAGPVAAGFFINLTPLFAAVLSLALLGEAPHLYHLFAFMLIVAGIVVPSRRT
ncbi:DMT family transporter [Diaphorobacter ruginosibacter]|uniref:DMT family transporter n=1 Tax=Diaphorobacter ruginosibacter TaxID=1715720 RepID=A0A7G9RR19_9BURK|nr:DMT family transporter [Diaphorobacter ruginosibacter]QNN58044.1 DMT family transporter [Diaphorobacter ruginosibacter]